MRKAIKEAKSKILVEGLRYSNSTTNKKISEILLVEQKGFCAYTDEFISRTDARDIEHFNPSLKGTEADCYSNWFLVKHQWNLEKKDWDQFQPVLHPTAIDLEERIAYFEGDYFAKVDTDVEALNLIRLLKLDDPRLAEKRKKYLNRKKEDMKAYGQNAQTFFGILIQDDACEVSYPRAIREEFGVNILELS